MAGQATGLLVQVPVRTLGLMQLLLQLSQQRGLRALLAQRLLPALVHGLNGQSRAVGLQSQQLRSGIVQSLLCMGLCAACLLYFLRGVQHLLLPLLYGLQLLVTCL